MEWLTCIKASIDYIENHIKESINIDDVADQCHVSSYYLQVGFQIMTGYSIGEYSYLQVARTIYGEEDENGVDRTQEREYRSLEQIQDNYPKYILSLDYLLQRRSGILHKNIADMMSKNEGFTGLN